jgi:cell division protein DivIC
MRIFERFTEGIMHAFHLLRRSIDKVVSLSGLFLRSRYGTWLKNKYVLTSLLFLIWMLFFDQNNLVQRYADRRNYDLLLEEKNYYQEKIEEDRNRIDELKTDNENLEKFAREQYLMKKDDEDIFIIVDGNK